MLKKILLGISLVLLLLLAGSLAYGYSLLVKPIAAQVDTVVVEEGDGLRDLAQGLKQQGIIPSEWVFLGYVWYKGWQQQIKGGEYPLKADMTVADLAAFFTQGNPLAREVKVQFIEGWTARDMAGYLREQGVAGWQDFLNDVRVNDTRKILPEREYDFLADKPANADLEGYLFPDTYRIFRDASGTDIIGKMLDNFGSKVTPELRAEATRQGWSLFDVVTLASIVEKEGKTKEDRRNIAHVFIKRLAINMSLQSDATVNYVTGKDELQPTFDDLAVESLYNTYQQQGLPPGPISNPSLESIEAVIYPAENDYYYFLTKHDGETVFSVTGEEHLSNKQKYLD